MLLINVNGLRNYEMSSITKKLWQVHMANIEIPLAFTHRRSVWQLTAASPSLGQLGLQELWQTH